MFTWRQFWTTNAFALWMFMFGGAPFLLFCYWLTPGWSEFAALAAVLLVFRECQKEADEICGGYWGNATAYLARRFFGAQKNNS